mgnify:CR=1 FL=1
MEPITEEVSQITALHSQAVDLIKIGGGVIDMTLSELEENMPVDVAEPHKVQPEGSFHLKGIGEKIDVKI